MQLHMLIHYTANTFLFYFQVFLISQPDYDSLDEQDLPAQGTPWTLNSTRWDSTEMYGSFDF